MAVYSYQRVSSTEQTEGTSLETQEAKCRGAALMMESELTETFTDGGLSGSVPLAERAAGADMLARLGPGDTVIVKAIDRLFRSAADALATVEEWKKQGISLVIADFGSDPVTENGTSKFLFGVLSMVAELERQTIRDRVALGRAAKKAAGGHIGGSTPFGYRKLGKGRGAMLEPVEAEQRAIDRMIVLKADGASLRGISEAIITEFGFKVSHVAVKNALLRRGEEPAQ